MILRGLDGLDGLDGSFLPLAPPVEGIRLFSFFLFPAVRPGHRFTGAVDGYGWVVSKVKGSNLAGPPTFCEPQILDARYHSRVAYFEGIYFSNPTTNTRSHSRPFALEKKGIQGIQMQ